MLVMGAWNLWRRLRNKVCNISPRNRLKLLAVVTITILLLIMQYRIKKVRNHGRGFANREAELQKIKNAAVDNDLLQNITEEIIEDQASIELPSWVCRNDKCEQVSAINVSKVQSLETCNMLCSSTQLWPQPTGPVLLREPAIPVRADRFRLQLVRSPSEPVSQHVRAAFTLMVDDLRRLERDAWSAPARGGGAARGARAVLVAVSASGSGDPRLTLTTDESYNLTVSGGVSGGGEVRATVSARSFCGVRHALETLSQLVWWDPYEGALQTLATASVADSPRFHYRGLMLDTARHFYPLAELLRTVDAMGAVKLNTFHWHVSDSQAFPLRLRSAPQLARHGAYGAREQYSPADVRALVRRARLRGVRVLVEVDAPAHVGAAWSWGPHAGLGPLTVQCPGEPYEGHLNPLNPHVYTLLGKIYAEIIQLTGVDDVFHLGGDEVSLECWERLAERHEPQGAMELWANFTRRAMLELKRANGGKAPNVTLLWSSPLTEQPGLRRLGEGLAVQVWHDENTFEATVRAGLRSVVSLVDWYLDCGFGSWRSEEPGHCQYRSWQQMYNTRPWDGGGRSARVLGGEACAWSEQLDGSGLDARVWPRAAAVAERLWADPEDDVLPDVYLRLDTLRARLLARGVRAAPLWPRWCTLNPHLCPT